VTPVTHRLKKSVFSYYVYADNVALPAFARRMMGQTDYAGSVNIIRLKQRLVVDRRLVFT